MILASSLLFTGCGNDDAIGVGGTLPDGITSTPGGSGTDTTAPVITVFGENPVDIEYNSVYTDAGATATDNLDPTVTVVTTGDDLVDTSTVGTYTVTYR